MIVLFVHWCVLVAMRSCPNNEPELPVTVTTGFRTPCVFFVFFDKEPGRKSKRPKKKALLKINHKDREKRERVIKKPFYIKFITGKDTNYKPLPRDKTMESNGVTNGTHRKRGRDEMELEGDGKDSEGDGKGFMALMDCVVGSYKAQVKLGYLNMLKEKGVHYVDMETSDEPFELCDANGSHEALCFNQCHISSFIPITSPNETDPAYRETATMLSSKIFSLTMNLLGDDKKTAFLLNVSNQGLCDHNGTLSIQVKLRLFCRSKRHRIYTFFENAFDELSNNITARNPCLEVFRLPYMHQVFSVFDDRVARWNGKCLTGSFELPNGVPYDSAWALAMNGLLESVKNKVSCDLNNTWKDLSGSNRVCLPLSIEYTMSDGQDCSQISYKVIWYEPTRA